jgi:hypothetical protein
MREVGAAILALAICATPALAQHSGAPTGAPRQECLSDADRELIVKLKALNRPTTERDPPPPFNPDYFSARGRWNATRQCCCAGWRHSCDVKHVDGCFYEGGSTRRDQAEGVRRRSDHVRPTAKYLTWIETDSRGYTLFKPGDRSDSGGYFALFRDPGIQVKGRTSRRAARSSPRRRISASGVPSQRAASRT